MRHGSVTVSNRHYKWCAGSDLVMITRDDGTHTIVVVVDTYTVAKGQVVSDRWVRKYLGQRKWSR